MVIDELYKILTKQMPQPKGAVHLSLDDCWRDNLINVVPIIEQYKIPVTFFASIQPIEDGTFWWIKVNELNEEEKIKLKTNGKFIDEPYSVFLEVIDYLDNKIYKWDREVMNKKELKTIAKNEYLEIGNHTVNHPFLTTGNEEDIENEILICHTTLTEWLGHFPDYFSYPIGDYDDRVVNILKDFNYKLAFTTEKQFTTMETDRYKIPRFSIRNEGSFAENSLKIFGVWHSTIKPIKNLMINKKK